MTEEKLEAWRQGSGRPTYKKGEYVRHNGRKFVCHTNHYATSVVEPGKGDFWTEYWDMIEEAPTTSAKDVSISTEEVSFPPLDTSTMLFFSKPDRDDGPKPVDLESAEDKSEWPWKGAWNDDIGFEYKADDCVDHDGVSYRCLYDHFSSPNLEPGRGKTWHMVWQRLGRTKPEHQPKAEPKAKLFFAAGVPDSMEEVDFERLLAADRLASIEEVDLDRLKELVDSGECNIHFELKQPCKTIRISQMELIEIEETEEGIVAHFLMLRDLTEEEE